MTGPIIKHFKAIAAMSENRVIGNGSAIPWHLPEDFKWFKQMTTGQIVIMGRKTFESIGRPLPNRETIIMSRSGFTAPGIRTIRSLDEVNPDRERRDVFICGGAEIYKIALPHCSDLYLTHVKLPADGDIVFPPFEDVFVPVETVVDNADFRIVHYQHRALRD